MRNTLALIAFATMACSPDMPADARLEATVERVSSDNGFTLNGLITNGLITNGLITNGLILNGLILNGFETEEFRSWFETDPAFADVVMRYVVICAVPAGETRTYYGATGTRTWSGSLGLAPRWSAGEPIPRPEQELVSACLAAHANKTGKIVTVSIRGYHATGEPIATTDEERREYGVAEGCFFGNLFSGEGVFAAFDRRSPLARKGNCSVRECAANNGSAGECPPIVASGACQEACRRRSGEFHGCESAEGSSFVPVVTYLRESDVFPCEE